MNIAPIAKSPPRHQRVSRAQTYRFGVAYYPEHWTAEEARMDPERMATAGVNTVRMAEFAWDCMEPRRGEFDFSLFDTAIERLGAAGIDTILCVPTAAPPRWLTQEHDEWMRVDANGNRMAHGSRQHCCTNHPGFRAESERITEAMARHFGSNPHVVGWQTDNELFCHIAACFCGACTDRFRLWLRDKYGTIAALNGAWGTRFWAQTYDSFDQILLPIPDRPTHANPSQVLDHARFLSDSIGEFQRGQTKIVRAAQPRWWITHNGTFDHIDYWKFSEDLDFLGVDVYPGFVAHEADKHSWTALKCEEARSVSGTFIVPEQQAGAGGQRPYLHPTPPPGQMRLWAWQSIAHGADGVLHFRWRTCRFGAEIYWNGILDHDNIPRRRYDEFAQEGAELRRIGSRILGTSVLVKAAVLSDFEQDEAYLTMHMGLPSPSDQRNLAYKELLERHLPVGIVNASDCFDGVECLIIPSFVMMDEDLAARLGQFVENGGVLFATARTATRDRNNHVISKTPPGLLSELFGVSVEEFGKLSEPLLTLGNDIPAGAGYEILLPATASVVARWNETADGSPHAAPGQAAITVNRAGKGAAIYAGTYLSEENCAALIDALLSYIPLAPLARAGKLTEVTCRRGTNCRLVFALNHEPRETTIMGLPGGMDLLSGKACEGTISLPGYGVAVIEVGEEFLRRYL